MLLALTLLACSLFDNAPPTIAFELPKATVGGTLAIKPLVEDEDSGVGQVDLFVDGEFVARAEDGWQVDTSKLEDGSHDIKVQAYDMAYRTPNMAKWEGVITTDNTAPKVTAKPAAARQGQTMVLWVEIDEEAVHPSALFNERKVPLFQVKDSWRGLIGMDLREELGSHKILIEAPDAVGNVGSLEAEVTVTAGDFTKGGFIKLTAAQEKARKNEKAIAKTREVREKAYAHYEASQLWTEPFMQPIDGRVTSPYGKFRTYSDGKKSYHSGIDLALRRGTPIAAAADGIVLYSAKQAIFGKVVIVHHGHGVTTSYNHMDELKVKEGAKVKKGDIVGLLGSTGQSTGPHLHWGLTVAGKAVDPTQWLDPEFWETLGS